MSSPFARRWSQSLRRTRWGLAATLFFGGMTTYGLAVPLTAVWLTGKLAPEAVHEVRLISFGVAAFGCAWAAQALSQRR